MLPVFSVYVYEMLENRKIFVIIYIIYIYEHL